MASSRLSRGPRPRPGERGRPPDSRWDGGATLSGFCLALAPITLDMPRRAYAVRLRRNLQNPFHEIPALLRDHPVFLCVNREDADGRTQRRRREAAPPLPSA